MSTPTHCPYCAMQCGMNLVAGGGGLLTVAPRPDFPTNKGGLCQKGWTSTELLSHPDRLTTPLMRLGGKGGTLRPVSWDEALDRVAYEITAVQTQHGRDAVGVFGGGGLTNEKAYLLGKFARVALRTPHIDYNGRFCMASEAAAGIKAFGVDRGLPFPLEDIAATEAILLIGGNPAETMPPIMQYFDRQRQTGGALIVADPRKTATAQAATLHLQLTPGTDAALANGLLHIAASDGLLDHDFITARTNGYEAVRRIVASYWPDRVERITGVPTAQLTKAAHLLGEAATGMVLTARGAGQQSKGVDNTLAFINLALALGKAGRPRCGYGCITGQGNGQGGREHGQKADQLPGYRKIADPQHRAHVAAVWGVNPDDLPGPGRSAYELLDSLGTDGGARALLVFASNLVVSAPRAGHVEQRLDALDFLAVADIFLSETAQRADVVLPITQWAEEEGTMTNLEGRVLRRRRAQAPPPGVWSDTQILTALAGRLGAGRLFPSSEPRVIFDELRLASAGGAADYAGITYERIESEDGVFWPCPSEDRPGTPRLFLDRFATEDGRATFHPVHHRSAAEEPDDEYPLYLTTGRVMNHYQSGAQTRRVKALRDAVPEAYVEIHPALARRFGIADGDPVTLTTRRGSAQVLARFTPTIRQDTLFVPFHWAGVARANLLTNPALDPTSRMPEFKVCAVRVEKG
ncbi:MAG: molybdopterin oxidoreductase family protein [Armatimonadetes bacterium]|nr:molybdopterin oxidoreductase family protein [Armatimonadota bacterium]